MNALFFIIGALILINPISNKSESIAQTSTDGYVNFTQEGVASWYGPGFHGKKTASGERFNTNDLTAAHKTLPFGTRVRVTNLSNGKTTVVRINDRGPFVKGRIIDLSQAAKQQLEMGGTAEVKLETVNSESEENEEEDANLSVPVTLFENTLPVSTKVFVEYLNGENEGAAKLTKEEFNDFLNSAKKIKIKVLTPDSEDATANIYQETTEAPFVNYYDITNRVNFVKGYSYRIAEFNDKALAYELVGLLESNNFGTIFIEEMLSNDSTNYTIYTGNYKTKQEANKDKTLLKKMNYKPVLVKIGS